MLFTSQSSGARSVDCIIEQVRVRSIRNLATSAPPVITLGAPPSVGANFFATLEVPSTPGLGAVLDLGLGVGPLKTFICRGNVPPGARFVIVASMDGLRFDEVVTFTADQQGTRSRSVMCRYLRVQRSGAAGPPPFISVGGAPPLELGGGLSGGGGASLVLALDGGRGNVSGAEEVLYESTPSLSALGAFELVGQLSGLFRSEGTGGARFRVRVGGTPMVADGLEVVTLDVVPPSSPTLAHGAPFTTPTEPATLVKVTSEGRASEMRAMVLRFRPHAS